MKRIMLLAVITGALTVPATADANGIGAGGVAGCAAAFGINAGMIAPVTQVSVYPGPPGPMAGPNSVIDWAPLDGKNNGTSLVGFCQTQ